METFSQPEDVASTFRFDQSASERINYLLQDSRFELPQSEEIKFKIKRMVDHPYRVRPKSMLLLAHPDMGKTYIAQEVVSCFPSSKNTARGRAHRPVLYCEVEPATTVIRLLCTFAAAADIPVHSVANRELQNHVYRQLKEMNVKLIIVDEIQTLLHSSTTVAQNCCDLLKWLSNVLRRPVVAIGTPDAIALFNRDKQLASRFQRQDIPKWGLNIELQSFVRTILSQLPLNAGWEGEILEEKALRLLLSVSGGTTGGILDHIKECAIEVLNDGRERLAVVDLFPEG